MSTKSGGAAVAQARTRAPQPDGPTILELLGGEWMLRRRPNSGGVILARAIQVSALIFALALLIESAAHPSAMWPSFSLDALRVGISAHVAWLGAIFGATYALLHARFTGQWTYLAGVYNSLMAAEDAGPRETLAASFDHMRREKRMTWWIGFIEDAVNVHLALKPTYAEAIFSLLDEPECIEVLADSQHPLTRRLLPVLPRLARAAGATTAELQALQDHILSARKALTSVQAARGRGCAGDAL